METRGGGSEPQGQRMIFALKRFARRLLLKAFQVSVVSVDALGWLVRKCMWIVRPFAWRSTFAHVGGPGISIVIPERANEELLGECLDSAVVACAECQEPAEIIVVVNGSEPDRYKTLQARHPAVRWLFYARPLWFSGAVREGLRTARYDWVYLLNSDMVVDRASLREASRWRDSRVFAVASQIFFKNAARRREETGWTNYRIQDGLLEIFDQPPDDPETVRGTLYAGGGSSLFQKAILQHLIERAVSYEPFYWEDVEWGVRAWRLGYESLFCPASKVWHSHRATNLKFFTAEEIDRIFHRNRILFHTRNPMEGTSNRRLLAAVSVLDRTSLLELLAARRWCRALAARFRSFLSPLEGLSLPFVTQKFYLRPPPAVRDKPLILVVSPYRLYPPSHGGAVRLHHLIRSLGARSNLILLSDEADSYSPASRRYFSPLCSVHLVGGRSETDQERNDRVARIKNHSHRILEEQLRMLADIYRPAVVQIEFVELAALARARTDSTPWFLTLHDVLLSACTEDFTPADHYELKVIRQYDRVLACCEEDAGLVPVRNVSVIPNGIELDGRSYVPSTGRRLLFLGPFRYSPNLHGIQVFLGDVYPDLKRAIPELELWILGGDGASQWAAEVDCFRQNGVTVFDLVEDTRSVLDVCTATINPLVGIRGSCLKVIESLGAGRVCISTREGARGFLHLGSGALITKGCIHDFAEPIADLLLNPAKRLAIEQTPRSVLAQHTWTRSAQLLADIYVAHCAQGEVGGDGWRMPEDVLYIRHNQPHQENQPCRLL